MDDVIRDAIRRAFERLVSQDGALFECPIEDDATNGARKLHEVCINHRLAMYLQAEMLPILGDGGDVFVDIEFNREGPRPKNVSVAGTSQLARPDIIVHNRKSDSAKHNLLVVECKKADAPDADRERDRQKVRAFMEDQRYQYVYGLQVIYGKGTVDGEFFCRKGSVIVGERIH